MRAAVGLPPPERLVGLRAHDVMTAACAPRVVLSCRLRESGAPANRSRWLERLVALGDGVGEGALAAMRARGAALLALVDPLERPAASVPAAQRPRPRPPVALRPRLLSATEVETLIRDPFAVYARRVLGLRPLDPVGRPLDARDRGMALHRALERLARAEGDAEAAMAAAEAALAAEAAPEALRRLWAARLARARARLLAGEAGRRAARAGPSLVEAKGLRVDAARDFTLTARADRIDPLPGGRVAIYDYKSGAAPSDKQIDAFAKQLPLEGAIAMAGGFEGLGPARPALLAHIVLGGGEAGLAKPLGENAEEAAEKAWAGLLKLIAAYDDPATGYPARARPRFLRDDGDYDHLARFGEWEDGQ
jgi:RecB family exonuclease